MATRTHYTILGVSRHASSEEVRVAYLNLARALHPDRLVDAAPAERRLAERRMREVNESYEVLRDSARRTDYDRALRAEERPARPRPEAQPAPQPDPRPEHVDPDNLEVSPFVAFVLTRGPLIALLLLAAFLFIATAYAGGPSDDDTSVTSFPTTTICVDTASC
ncbi:MAG: DnaJ domain-containing protein [Acidimicrobiales bacterium]